MTHVPSHFYDVTELGDVTILAFKLTRLSEEENLEQIDEEWQTLVGKKHLRHLILDFSSVRFLTSAAIAKLISWNRRLVRDHGRLVICSLHSEVCASLDTANLTSYFHIAPTIDEAVTLFSVTS